jgi:hypothetical protein
MNHALVSTNYSHSMADMLKSHAILKALPTDFVLQSSAQKSLMIDPNLTAEKLLPLIKGWKPIVVLDSTIYFKSKKVILSATFMTGRVDVHVYSAGMDAEIIAAKTIQPFEKFKFENKEEGGVWVNFCYAGGMGGVERNTQFMRCPTWSEIQDNYPAASRNELVRTINTKKPWTDGRLMIWHGIPGSGKTFAIRSLLMAWRDQFNFIIVADPEKMMASPSYYYEVASAPNMNSVPGTQPQDDDDEDSSQSKKKRLLFIVEDAGDLIAASSRQRHWDKFGKLLNITDGLIGQGREDIFLFTFNEQIEAIDPAIIRPGRCISQIEFQKFPTEDAQEWLVKNKLGHLETCGADTLEPVTLAELYQMKAKAKKQVPVTV